MRRWAALLGAGLACLTGLTGEAPAQGFSNPLRRGQPVETPCVLDKCLKGGGTSSPRAPADPAQANTSKADPAQTDPPATDTGQDGGFGRARQPRGGFGNGRNGGGASRSPGDFDFYVLALSWSPGFCDTGGAAKAGQQCAEGAELGFVVHGLWPQYTRGFPSDCDAGSRFPTRAALDTVRGLYPDEGLARYEWRKHGTCTGLSPGDYFGLVRRARYAVQVPADLQAPAEPQTMAPLDLARAFVAANPGLRTDMMAVTCRQDELAEVRICFGKDLRGFVSCPEVSRGACRTRQISVLPVR